MRRGIYFYERGEDTQAMDQFMSVLTRGEPSERALANEYLNLISHRMNLPGQPMREKRKAAEPAASDVAAVSAAPARMPASRVQEDFSPSARASAPPPEAVEEKPAQNKALMQKEIKAKIQALLDRSVAALKAQPGVKVVPESGQPQALGIPTELLFQSGLSFQKSAAKVLESLVGLSYALSGAQIMILPEGSAFGDAKVLDMRRTMGLSAHLFSAGIAPPRVRINLLSSQVDIPKGFQDFRGVLLLFVYNQPLNLAVESSVGEESGPPVSLGVYPDRFRPEKGEGAIIEFSVSDPPAGLLSWKFQLLRPGESGSTAEMAPLQEVVGGAPVYHQIYWNGRKNYFGQNLPSGRYELVLSAVDAKNRQKTLHRWIHLPGAQAAAAALAAPEAAPATVGAPTAELPRESPEETAALIRGGGTGKPAFVQLGNPAPKVRKRKKRAALRKPARRRAAQAAAQAPSKEATKDSAAPRFELAFAEGSFQLAAEAESKLKDVAQKMTYYPLETVDLVGYAQASEPDAAALAQKRAQVVAGLLINKFSADPKRIQVRATVAETGGGKVAVSFMGKE